MIVYGSPMGDPNVHNHKRCPLIVLGGANDRMAGNVHLKADAETPMANVMLSLLHNLGHDDLESFGDSTGEFSLSV
jgi:chitinase